MGSISYRTVNLFKMLPFYSRQRYPHECAHANFLPRADMGAKTRIECGVEYSGGGGDQCARRLRTDAPAGGFELSGIYFCARTGRRPAEAALRAARTCLRVVVMPLWKGASV